MKQKSTKLGGLTSCHAPSIRESEYCNVLDNFVKNAIMTPDGTFIHKYIH